MTQDDQENLVRPLGNKKKQALLMGIVLVSILGAGVVTGYLLSGAKSLKSNLSIVQSGTSSKGTEVGSENTKTFKDTATGVLEKGGLDGEGTHKLIREGGPSQTAYLTSSVIDLDQFSGKKVQVWGETFQGQKAGWLMDVGRVKIIE